MKRVGKFWIDADGNRTRFRPVQAGEQKHATPDSRDEQIRKIVEGLDKDNQDNWTKQGKPQMSVIEELLGDTGVTRKEVDAATGGYVRG